MSYNRLRQPVCPWSKSVSLLIVGNGKRERWPHLGPKFQVSIQIAGWYCDNSNSRLVLWQATSQEASPKCPSRPGALPRRLTGGWFPPTSSIFTRALLKFVSLPPKPHFQMTRKGMESTSTDGTNSCKMSFKRIPDIMVRETDNLELG